MLALFFGVILGTGCWHGAPQLDVKWDRDDFLRELRRNHQALQIARAENVRIKERVRYVVGGKLAAESWCEVKTCGDFYWIATTYHGDEHGTADRIAVAHESKCQILNRKSSGEYVLVGVFQRRSYFESLDYNYCHMLPYASVITNGKLVDFLADDRVRYRVRRANGGAVVDDIECNRVGLFGSKLQSLRIELEPGAMAVRSMRGQLRDGVCFLFEIFYSPARMPTSVEFSSGESWDSMSLRRVHEFVEYRTGDVQEDEFRLEQFGIESDESRRSLSEEGGRNYFFVLLAIAFVALVVIFIFNFFGRRPTGSPRQT